MPKKSSPPPRCTSRRRRRSRDFGGAAHLERLPLDSGGYDAGGAYWGCVPGSLMYVAHDEAFDIALFTRAGSRAGAAADLRKTFGDGLKFKRERSRK